MSAELAGKGELMPKKSVALSGVEEEPQPG